MKLVTGGTGFLGRELLGRLLLKHPASEFAVLVRAADQSAAEQRVRELLNEVFAGEVPPHVFSRLRVLRGDLSLPQFGMGDSDFAALAQTVDEIFHAAAHTDLAQPLAEARMQNVGSTEHVLQLASRHTRKNQTLLHHVSTAYVAGDRPGEVRPSELQLSAPFRNAYEQSKAEAEALVRAAGPAVNTRIYRPSVVVGDSHTGQTSAFNVIYIPARFVMKGLLKVLPANSHTPFDVVPVDYVADAICHLSQQTHASGSCFHLAAGIGRESSPREILGLIIKTFNTYGAKNLAKGLLQLPPLIAPEILALAKSSLKQIERVFSQRIEYLLGILPFVPYMTQNPRFDTRTTELALNGRAAPLFVDYAERVFCYCLDTNWGKRPWENPARLKPWNLRTVSY